MSALLFRLIRSEVRRSPLGSMLVAVGVALAMVLVVCVQPAVDLATTTLTRGLERVVGRAQLHVVGQRAEGLPMALVRRAREVAGVARVAAVVDAFVACDEAPNERLHVVGAEVRSQETIELLDAREAVASEVAMMRVSEDPQTLALSARFAERHAIRVGATIGLKTAAGRRRFIVAGLLRDEALRIGAGDVAVMNLTAAGRLVGRPGRVDRIDVGLTRDVSSAGVRAALQVALGGDAVVETPMGRGDHVDAMVRACTLLAAFLGSLALAASALMVFGTAALRVAERRRELALLRVLGATRTETLVAAIGDVAALGAFGALVGAMVGAIAAGRLVGATAGLVASLTGMDVARHAGAVAPAAVFSALLVALVAVVVAAGAAAVGPAMGEVRDGLLRVPTTRAAWAGAGWSALPAALIVALILVDGERVARTAGIAGGGLVSVLLAIATMLVLPVTLQSVCTPVVGAAMVSTSAWLALHSLRHHGRRFAAAATAIAVALEVSATTSAVATSFECGIRDWVTAMVDGSLFVTAATSITRQAPVGLDAAVGDVLARVPGVSRVGPSRQAWTALAGAPIAVRASTVGSGPPTFQSTRYRFVEGEPAAACVALGVGASALVSENLARRLGLALGSRFDLRSPNGTVSLSVAGVVVDFSAPGGTVIVSRDLYLDRWRDTSVDGFFLDVDAGATLPEVRRAVLEHVGDRFDAHVVDAHEVVGEVVAMLDRAFVPLRAVALTTLVVGILALLNAVLASVVGRRGELALLRALGASRTQVATAVLFEATSVTAIAAALGAAAGAVGARAWIRETIPAVTGWLVRLQVSIAELTMAIAIAIGLAAVAAALPAMQAGRTRIASTLADL